MEDNLTTIHDGICWLDSSCDISITAAASQSTERECQNPDCLALLGCKNGVGEKILLEMRMMVQLSHSVKTSCWSEFWCTVV